MKTLKQYHWQRSGVFIINFNIFQPFSTVSTIAFEQLKVCWSHKNVKDFVNENWEKPYIYRTRRTNKISQGVFKVSLKITEEH